jgi:hypothetical protein
MNSDKRRFVRGINKISSVSKMRDEELMEKMDIKIILVVASGTKSKEITPKDQVIHKILVMEDTKKRIRIARGPSYNQINSILTSISRVLVILMMNLDQGMDGAMTTMMMKMILREVLTMIIRQSLILTTMPETKDKRIIIRESRPKAQNLTLTIIQVSSIMLVVLLTQSHLMEVVDRMEDMAVDHMEVVIVSILVNMTKTSLP